MDDGSASIAPASDDPEDRTAWRLAMLRELAELGMEMARAVRDEAVARSEPAEEGEPRPPARFPAGDLGLVYSRIARAVRQTLALHERIAEDGRKAGVERARSRVAAIRAAAEDRQNEIRDYVAEAIEAEAAERHSSRPEVERLLDDLDERIEAGAYDDGLDDAPIGELVARICADLGVIPDWSLWDHDWAIDHLKAQASIDIGAERWRDLGTPAAGLDPPTANGPPPDSG